MYCMRERGVRNGSEIVACAGGRTEGPLTEMGKPAGLRGTPVVQFPAKLNSGYPLTSR